MKRRQKISNLLAITVILIGSYNTIDRILSVLQTSTFDAILVIRMIVLAMFSAGLLLFVQWYQNRILNQPEESK